MPQQPTNVLPSVIRVGGYTGPPPETLSAAVGVAGAAGAPEAPIGASGPPPETLFGASGPPPLTDAAMARASETMNAESMVYEAPVRTG
jgi:hypothetical protein